MFCLNICGSLVLLLLPVCLHAWKPIVVPAHTSSNSHVYTAAFSLEQTHPELNEDNEKIFVGPKVRKIKPYSTLAPINVHDDEDLSPVTTSPIRATVVSYRFPDLQSGPDDTANHHMDYADTEARILSGEHGYQPHCSLKKFAFNQDGVVVYNNKLPDLYQFTICFWMRFTNHSGDHVILTYATKKEPRAVQFWIANSQNVSYISMAIKGQQMYRLNYPFKMHKWHHACSSWNGKSGEWQVWIKAERVGRGFHNSLVGHIIPANGKLYSGGPSVTGAISDGLHFEVTLIQIYRIALTAGKAHRDHKHHHVHMVDYEGQELKPVTRPPPMINRPQAMHSLLANGQIPTRVRLNLAQPRPTAQRPASTDEVLTLNTNFLNGQINGGSRLVSEQLIGQPAGPLRPQPTYTHNIVTTQVNNKGNSNNIQFVDETETHIVFKRHSNATDKTLADKNHKKRELVLLTDGRIVDDSLASGVIKFDGLAEFAGQKYKNDISVKMNLDEEISAHDQEPAEDEVKAIMGLCSSCDPEPFEGALVLTWKDIKEELDNTLRGAGSGRCGDF